MRIWKKMADEIDAAIVNVALEEPDLSPRSSMMISTPSGPGWGRDEALTMT
jgi:hypothetical protein